MESVPYGIKRSSVQHLLLFCGVSGHKFYLEIRRTTIQLKYTHNMTTVAALRTYLRNVIGLGSNPEGLERANAIIDEGVRAPEDLADLYDNKGVKVLCANVRKPGGTIDDPAHTGAGPAPQIPKPGKQIPTICEGRLNLAAYGAKLYDSTGRDVDTANLNRARLRHFKAHMAMVTNHKEPEDLAPISKSFTVVKFLDQLPTYIKELHGVDKVSLAYLIRDNATPPNPLPPLKPNLPWSEGVDSIMEELVAFTPYSGPSYVADNARLFGILSKALSGTASMASITQYQSKGDGRKAYLALVTHNLGSNKWEHMVDLAEKMLNQRKWDGKNSRYPLKLHVARHREAFNDMERASEHIAFNVPNGTSRVRYLLNSIESDNPTLCSCKTTIQADSIKKNDFEKAVDFLLTNAPKSKVNQTHKISAIKSTKKTGKKGKVKTGPKTGVELRFYKRKEWMDLTQEQRDECIEIRRESREKRKLEDAERTDYSAKIAALESKVKAQELTISTLTSNSSNQTPTLPPVPNKNPLQPPNGFTQRSQDK